MPLSRFSFDHPRGAWRYIQRFLSFRRRCRPRERKREREREFCAREQPLYRALSIDFVTRKATCPFFARARAAHQPSASKTLHLMDGIIIQRGCQRGKPILCYFVTENLLAFVVYARHNVSSVHPLSALIIPCVGLQINSLLLL